MDTDKARDELWTQIRQLVLNEGPAAETLDTEMADAGIPDEAREAIVAELIAFHCAKIESLSEGPLQGAPAAFIVNAWVANIMKYEAIGG